MVSTTTKNSFSIEKKLIHYNLKWNLRHVTTDNSLIKTTINFQILKYLLYRYHSQTTVRGNFNCFTNLEMILSISKEQSPIPRGSYELVRLIHKTNFL